MNAHFKDFLGQCKRRILVDIRLKNVGRKRCETFFCPFRKYKNHQGQKSYFLSLIADYFICEINHALNQIIKKISTRTFQKI